MTWSDNAESLEVQAMMEGVMMTLDRGWPEIEVETIFQNVIAHIKGRMLSLEVICKNINALSRHFRQVRWKTISLSANESVNWIVKQARMSVRLDNWIQDPPPLLRKFLDFNYNNEPPWSYHYVWFAFNIWSIFWKIKQKQKPWVQYV